MVLSFSINLTASHATFIFLHSTLINVMSYFSANIFFAMVCIYSKLTYGLLLNIFVLKYFTTYVGFMFYSKFKVILLSSDSYANYYFLFSGLFWTV